MIKICFIFDSWTDEFALKVYSKMTPKRSGKWKDMVGVSNPDEADFCIIIDYTSRNIPKEKRIYIGAHPYILGYDSYKCFDGQGVARLDLRDTFGFGEWWLKYDYDYLSQLKPMLKPRDLICILSDAEGRPDHMIRKNYLKRFFEKHRLDLYGRIRPYTNNMLRCYMGVLGNPDKAGKDYWYGKEDVLVKYRYALEFDNGPCKHYFSERIFDDLLLWTMPIIALGADNIEDYLPKDSFRYANIESDGDDVMEIVKSGFYNVEAIAEARDLLLNKYQLWPRCYDLIKSL